MLDVQTLETPVGDTFVDEPENYSIEQRIGAGGMGVVLAARGTRFGRAVALKIPRSRRPARP